jgi:hypothetical protein
MAHEHSHPKDVNYYLEQICTIAICGALAGVAIMLYRNDILRFILADKFHLWVLVGGIALLTLVVIRAVTLWLSAEPGHTHACDHAHAHKHGDAHDCDHNHDEVEAQCHGHDHSWNPWRFAVLLLPVVLFFLNLPNQGFSHVSGNISADQVELHTSTAFSLGAEAVGMASPLSGAAPLSAAAAILAGTAQGDVLSLEFRELEQAAYHPGQRDFYQGKRAEIRGQFAPSTSPKMFTLVRLKITCCGADAVQLRVLIVSPEDVRKQRGQWVKVRGTIQFAKRKDRDEYVTILQMASPRDVADVEPPKSPYIQ